MLTTYTIHQDIKLRPNYHCPITLTTYLPSICSDNFQTFIFMLYFFKKLSVIQKLLILLNNVICDLVPQSWPSFSRLMNRITYTGEDQTWLFRKRWQIGQYYYWYKKWDMGIFTLCLPWPIIKDKVIDISATNIFQTLSDRELLLNGSCI